MQRHPQDKIAQRSGRVLFCVTVAVLCVFIGVLLYRNYIDNRDRDDPLRLKELQSAALDNTTAAGEGDWPQWRGPRRDGVVPDADLLADWPAKGPKIIWEKPSGKGYASLAVAQGRAFLIVQDPQEANDEAVVCWDANSGDELWRFRYPARLNDAYEGPRATATVDGDLVYTVGGTGMLHCLKAKPRAKGGEVVWKHNLLEEFGASNLRWGVSFSPLVVGDLVYTMPGGPRGNSLAAFDKRTGKLAWKALDDAAGYSSPIHVTLADKEQIVFFTGDGLVGVTPKEGQLLWRYPWQTSFGCNIATPIAVGDYLFISSGYGKGCAVVKIENQAGALTANLVYSNNRMRNHFSSCVFHKDHVYGFNEGVLTCLEFRTGAVRWRHSGFGKGSLLVAGNMLVILGDNGTLALAEATPKDYAEKASAEVSRELCWSMPVLANGLLYIRDEKTVRCLDLRKPKTS